MRRPVSNPANPWRSSDVEYLEDLDDRVNTPNAGPLAQRAFRRPSSQMSLFDPATPPGALNAIRRRAQPRGPGSGPAREGAASSPSGRRAP